MQSSADDAIRDFADHLKERLEKATSDASTVSSERQAFRKVAALLQRFDPLRLTLEAEDRSIKAIEHLVKDSHVEQVLTEGGMSWKLRPEVRQSALSSIDGPTEALDILEGLAPELQSTLTKAMLGYLRHEATPLEEQSLDELDVTMTAIRRLSQVPGIEGLPPEEDIERVRARRKLLMPFRALVGDSFYGREEELEKLREHVGVHAPQSLIGKAGRIVKSVRYVFSVEERPLVVFGPGGIGKSTLIAEFILEHTDLSEQRRFPFAYVDLERPSMTLSAPMSVCQEIVYQLKVQYPGLWTAWEELEEDFAREEGRQRQHALLLAETALTCRRFSTRFIDLSKRTRTNRIRREKRLLAQLAGLIRKATESDKDLPFLVVMDSFEEAQYRSSPNLATTWSLLANMRDAYPMVRVVISGRAPVERPTVGMGEPKKLRLGDLDSKAAHQFLREAGVTDPEEADELVKRFGGNPLSLRLVARLALAAEEDADWYRAVETRGFWKRLDDSMVQAQLYTRVLDHVHDPEVRKLAHPGLVLRTITPEIIAVVLAPHCGIDADDETAERLFLGLAREIDLVELEGTSALRHRPDIRRITLRLMEEDKPEMVRAIEEEAVRYYEAQIGPRARAEELYHRLRLGESPRSVEVRWEPGAARYLESAFEELPETAQGFLAAMIEGTEVSEGVEKEAHLQDWEYFTAREAANLLDQGQAKAALQLVQQRSERTPASVLFGIEAEALRRLGRDGDAYELALGAVDAAWNGRELKTVLEMQLLAAEVSLDRGKLAQAEDHLSAAGELAERLDRAIDALHIDMLMADLQSALGRSDRTTEIHDRLAERFLYTADEELDAVPEFVSRLAAMIGTRHSETLVKAITLLGFTGASVEDTNELADELEELIVDRPDWAELIEAEALSMGYWVHDDIAGNLSTLLSGMVNEGKLESFAQFAAREFGAYGQIPRILLDLLEQAKANRQQELETGMHVGLAGCRGVVGAG